MLESIDKSKPLTFYGTRTEVIGKQIAVAVTGQIDVSSVAYQSLSITDRTQLPPASSARLLDFLQKSTWRDDFEENLGGVSQSPESGERMIGWMSLKVFEFSVDAIATSLPDVADALAEMIRDWDALGVDEVNFEAYAKTELNCAIEKEGAENGKKSIL